MITLIFVRVPVIAFLILTITVTIRQLKRQVVRQTSDKFNTQGYYSHYINVRQSFVQRFLFLLLF